MKKLLGIVILCLLLSGCKTTNGILYQNQYGISFEIDDYRGKIVEQNIASNHCAKFGKFAFKFSGSYVNKEVGYQCFQNYTDTYGDQKLIWTNFNSNNNNQASTNLTSTINSNKQKCIDMGFKAGSEKLAECVLRMIEIEEAKNNNQIVKQRQAEAGLAAALQSILNSTSGSSSNPRTTCFKSGEEIGGFNKICRYNCVGNLYTTNIGSTQICPITIQK